MTRWRWVEKKNDLLIELLYQMAQSLKFNNMDKLTIQKNSYHPKGFVEIETEQHGLRKAALAVLSGERPIQATVVGKVQTAPPMTLPAEIAKPALGAPKAVVPPLPTIDAKKLPDAT